MRSILKSKKGVLGLETTKLVIPFGDYVPYSFNKDLVDKA